MGAGVGFKICFGVSSYRIITFVFWVSLYHVVLRSWWWGGSQQLLCLNPTTVMVVLLLGLWLLLGCDNKGQLIFYKELKTLNITTKISQVFLIYQNGLTKFLPFFNVIFDKPLVQVGFDDLASIRIGFSNHPSIHLHSTLATWESFNVVE